MTDREKKSMYNIKIEKPLIEKKHMFNKTCLTLTCVLSIMVFILVLIPIFIYNNNESITKNFKMIDDISVIIITLSTISIAIFQILIEKIDDRILGMSYKRIFLKSIIWEKLNFINSKVILADIMIVSIGLSFIKDRIETNIIQCILLILCIFFSGWIIRLSLIATWKKSIIYYKIKKKINNDKNNDKMVLNITQNISILEKESYKERHNSYLYEEIAILIYVINFIDDKNQHYIDSDEFKKIIVKIITNMIVNDDRSLYEISENIKYRAKNEFNDQRQITELENILNKINVYYKQQGIDRKSIVKKSSIDKDRLYRYMESNIIEVALDEE